MFVVDRSEFNQHLLLTHWFGCGICGEMFKSSDAVKTCFFDHTLCGLGCGICEEMSSFGNAPNLGFINHPRFVCSICGELFTTSGAVKACFYSHPSYGCGICGEMSSSRDAVRTCFYQHFHNTTSIIPAIHLHNARLSVGLLCV